MITAKDNTLTVAAIAIIAMCLTTAAHEAVGHGGFCLASGWRITLLTSAYFQCSPSDWSIAAAGPIGNIAWGLIATFIASNLRGALRLLFALTAMFSLLWEAGYMMYSAIRADGDYFFALRGMFGAVTPFACAILGAVGVALYLIAINLGRALLRPFATESVRVREILRTAWIAATLAAIAAALLYPANRTGAATQAFLEIGAASAAFMLLRREYDGGDALPVQFSIIWLILAVMTYATFALTLGRGISA